jgi:hypothetical protein
MAIIISQPERNGGNISASSAPSSKASNGGGVSAYQLANGEIMAWQ